jgi:hypothetical protein
MEDDLSDLFINDPDIDAMSNSGSVCCLSKRTLTNLLECAISCVAYVSLIYIALLIYSLAAGTELDLSFHVIGFISVFSLVTTPVGIFGCSYTSYCALFTFLLLASYHLYGLTMYFWFSLKAPIFISSQTGSNTSHHKEYEYLHYLASGSYTGLVALSILLTLCKIVSLVEELEPARVIVLDNSSE